MAKRKRTEGQTIIYKTLHIKLKISTKNWGELKCSGGESSSCSTSGTCRVSLVTNPVISHERAKIRKVYMKSGTYPWSFVTQIFRNCQPRMGLYSVRKCCKQRVTNNHFQHNITYQDQLRVVFYVSHSKQYVLIYLLTYGQVVYLIYPKQLYT